MENYTTGTGQRLVIHDRAKCQGQNCVIHNPSDHSMKDWPTNWRPERYLMERICPHGVGHPDPDDLSFKRSLKGGKKLAQADSIHGCDGCCSG